MNRRDSNIYSCASSTVGMAMSVDAPFVQTEISQLLDGLLYS